MSILWPLMLHLINIECHLVLFLFVFKFSNRNNFYKSFVLTWVNSWIKLKAMGMEDLNSNYLVYACMCVCVLKTNSHMRLNSHLLYFYSFSFFKIMYNDVCFDNRRIRKIENQFFLEFF